MNKITQTFGNNAKERTASALADDTAGAVRKPLCNWCTQCQGEGTIRGYRTDNPDEREKTYECPRCDGWGLEPETEEEEE